VAGQTNGIGSGGATEDALQSAAILAGAKNPIVSSIGKEQQKRLERYDVPTGAREGQMWQTPAGNVATAPKDGLYQEMVPGKGWVLRRVEGWNDETAAQAEAKARGEAIGKAPFVAGPTRKDAQGNEIQPTLAQFIATATGLPFPQTMPRAAPAQPAPMIGPGPQAAVAPPPAPAPPSMVPQPPNLERTNPKDLEPAQSTLPALLAQEQAKLRANPNDKVAQENVARITDDMQRNAPKGALSVNPAIPATESSAQKQYADAAPELREMVPMIKDINETHDAIDKGYSGTGADWQTAAANGVAKIFGVAQNEKATFATVAKALAQKQAGPAFRAVGGASRLQAEAGAIISSLPSITTPDAAHALLNNLEDHIRKTVEQHNTGIDKLGAGLAEPTKRNFGVDLPERTDHNEKDWYKRLHPATMESNKAKLERLEKLRRENR
jgi:hypothetical protein